MDSEDLAQIADSLGDAIDTSAGAAREAVLDFGWRELLADDEAAAISILFRLSGERLVSGSFLDDVLVRASGLPALQDREGLAVVLPRPGDDRPASRLLDSGRVAVDGLVQQGSDRVVVPCVAASGQVALVVADAAEIPDRPEGEPLDPSAGWRLVQCELAVESEAAREADDVWERMTAAGHRATAYELLGTGGRMLDLTVDHVRTRQQFGHPLGGFQSVKHQLAEVRLWQEAATLAADAAWEDLGSVPAALAKVGALRFSRAARTVCQQLLGGMGFTWEHDFHRYLRRALTIEPLLGDARAVHASLGAAVRRGVVDDSLVSL